MRPHAHAARTRKLVILLAATGSLIAGCTLVWVFAPRAFRPLSTLELIVILGLLVLPGATLWAVLGDRKARPGNKRQATASPASLPVPPHPAPSAHAPPHLSRVQTHPASSRHARIGQQAHEHA